MPSYFAQSPAKKWAIVQDLQDKIVYLDTSAIKQYENQLSFWGLTRYREPQRLNPFNTLVQEVKSNFLVNTITNTYSVIGTLYYDKTGKIVGESSEPKLSGQDKFELPLQSGSSVEILYNKASNFMTGGTLTSEPGEFEYKSAAPPVNTAAVNTDTVRDTPRELPESQPEENIAVNDEPVKLSPEENIAIVDEQNKDYLDEQKKIADSIETSSHFVRDETPAESAQNAAIKTAQNSAIINTPAPVPPANKVEIPDLKVDTTKPKTKKAPASYNDSIDRNISGNYWSDGTTYVIQLSSWKRMNVAEEEAARYKSQGHNAFIMQVEIPGRGTWYRVRIGYFNSLGEAQSYKSSNNL